MKFFKSHKKLWITLGIIFLIIIMGLLLYFRFSPDSKKNLYGNRLDDIEKYSIDENRMNDMIARAQEFVGIESVSYHTQGRIVYINVTVSADFLKEQAVQYANTTLEYFTDEEKSYYDFQIIFVCNSESEIYPIMGAKHKTAETYVWKQE